MQDLAPLGGLLFEIAVELIDEDGHGVRNGVAASEEDDLLGPPGIGDAKVGGLEVRDEAAFDVGGGDVERHHARRWRGAESGGENKAGQRSSHEHSLTPRGREFLRRRALEEF